MTSSPPPAQHSPSLAARIGRWSTRHRGKAIAGWLAFVLAALVIGNAVGTITPSDDGSGHGDSATADRIVNDAYPDQASETVLVQSEHGRKATDPEFKATVNAVIKGVTGKPGVVEVQSPYGKGAGGQISPDGRSALVQLKIDGDDDLTEKRVDAVEAGVKAAAAAHPALFVGQFGDASADKALNKAFGDDFAKAGMLSIPVTLVILVLTFGALIAAGVPLLLGVTAVVGTIGLLGPISHVVSLNDFINEVVLLVGLAVGVDYSLFYLRREREEKARGHSPKDAVAIAAATSGRAVLISGVTVITAMAGMLLAGDSTFTALGIGAMLVVLVAMLGSVTVIPALLSGSGKWLERGRIPFLGKRMAKARERDVETGGKGWNLILNPVLRHPVVSVVSATTLLLVMASPLLHMHTADSGVDAIPRNLPVMKVYDKMQAAFPGGEIPATVVIKAKDVRTEKIAKAVDGLKRDALASGQVKRPIDVSISPDHHVMSIDLPIVGNGNNAASNGALATLRGDVVPKFAAAAGTKAYVTGDTAGSKDFNDLMKSRWPIVFGFVLSLAFLLLLMTFRSIVIPIKAIVLNLLSVGAAYGVLTWVFQDGHGEKLLGFNSTGSITSWLPMFLFVILFGLSMDYHVFILSRIREAYDRGMKTEDAVASGIRTTAGTVTSAAIVMVAVFAIFATLSYLDFKMMGVGLATAILIDATIVRAVLLPATMKLLGDWNWYLPKWLEWLPSLGHEESAVAAAAGPAPVRIPSRDVLDDERDDDREAAGVA
ncbi:Heme uptake protein MmpL11 [Baekduia alba]|uniref:MMPL family transporter n=1 Tax=Baekduia alba TaxID=2997333 RepID=UPI00233FC5C2|nr:MMPL family transporter [Baekduia alba]WCB92630.1 Heme uptake protein MmpL11 [Baekduia alba]